MFNKKNEEGFTFIELLYVLLIVSILSLLVVPPMYHVYQEQQKNQFFTLLDSDILYIQNQAIARKTNFRIVFDTEYYVVMEKDKQIYKRDYPNHLSYSKATTNRIVFNTLGTVRNPTTYLFYDQSKGKRYEMVFPLGKGRQYVEE